LTDNQQHILNREEHTFKKQMGENYIQEMANHKRKQLEEKLRNINEDNERIRNVEK
jgi:flagellar motility protein MotE (MotC chaperone)